MKQKREDPDFDLIQSFIIHQDKRSFTSLIARYQHDVYNFCFRFLGNAEDAADCSQEIFIRVFRHLPKFNFRAKFSTWLYRIMVNVCNDMTSSRKYRTNQIPLERETANGEVQALPVQNGAALTPEQLAIRKEIQEVFQAALSKIRASYRAVIILRDIEGRSYQEIASLTGMKLGTVRSTLARARLEMAGYLKEYRYEM